MIKFKCTLTPFNPAYKTKVIFYDTEAEADKLIADSGLGIGKKERISIPDEDYTAIRERLSECEQFIQLNPNDRMVEILMCYNQMLNAIETFRISRYAY